MKTNKQIQQLMVAFFIVTIIYTSYSQENFKTLGRYEYARFDGVWYTIVDGSQGDLVDTSHIIVRLKGKADISTFDFSQAGLPNLKNVRGRFADGFYEFKIPAKFDPFETARKLVETDKFEEVLFNVFLRIDDAPNDPLYNNQWNLPKIVTSQAWDITTGSSSIIVAVIDVGGDHNHEDLVGNRWAGIGYNFYNNNNNSDPYPPDNARHGTAVAGILGAVTNNSLGVSGVAGGWAGTGGIRIMHLRAGYRDINGNEWISLSAATQATNYAANNGAKVINMSFGGGAYLPFETAINNVVNNFGVVVVASAGNYQSGQSTSIVYPARYDNVIAVGATTPNDTRKELNDGTENWWGSCYGPELDVVAPGVYIRTTDLTGTIGYSTENYYDSFNGTSSAAPHVAGLAALIRSVNPSLTWQQVRDILRNTADDKGPAGFDIEYGYGRINTLRAIGTAYVTNQPDYEFVYNNVSLSYYNNANMVFLAGPNWCNSAGTYYNTERHRLLIEVNRSFTHTPLAWYLGPVGYSWANPNNATSWLSQTVNVNTIRYETVFYRLNQGNLSCENRWAPFDPNIREKTYAYLGRPLVAPIISNFTQSPNPLYQGNSGTVSCNLSQGNGDLNFNWSIVSGNTGFSISNVNSQTVSIHYSNTDAIGKSSAENISSPKDLSIEAPTGAVLKCKVWNTAGVDSANFFINLATTPHGCPFVYTWDGNTWVEDNNILPQSQDPDLLGQDVTDFYQLYTKPILEDNKYYLAIGEFEEEISYLDQLKLLVVDHPQETFITVDDNGEIIQFAKPAYFANAQLDSIDVYKKLVGLDSIKAEVSRNDTLKLTFEDVSAGTEKWLLLIGQQQPIYKDKIAGSIVGGGKENTATFSSFKLRKNPTYQWILVPDGNSSSLQVDIAFKSNAEIDYTELSHKLELPFTVYTPQLLYAEHSVFGDVTSLLNQIDEQYSVLNTDEMITLEYSAPPINEVMERTFILVTRGRYERLENRMLAKGKTKIENKNQNLSSTKNTNIVTEYGLSQNYPNPFNPVTTISYQIKEQGLVQLKVYNLLGQEIVSLVNEVQSSGIYESLFDASNFPSGVYIYSLRVNDFVQNNKMTLLK